MSGIEETFEELTKGGIILKISAYDILPERSRGNSWFWPLMKEGENGVEFAMRQPEVRPGDFSNGTLKRWTKVNPGGIVVLLVGYHTSPDAIFKAVVDRENRIKWPNCYKEGSNV